MTTHNVTLDQFLAAFAGKGTKFATMLTVTRPKLNKTNRDTKERCPFTLGVERRALRNVQIGANYENSVNNQREREDNPEEFTAQSLWNGKGQRDTTYTVKHSETGKRYFAVKPASDSETGVAIPPKSDEWRDVATGKVIPFDSVKPYLPPVSEQPATQETDKMISWRTIGVDSIVSIQCGETYMIQHEAT
jgi:hypothetical protein